MLRLAAFAAVLSAGALLLTGCEADVNQGEPAVANAACPDCGHTGPEGTYCPHCNAIMTTDTKPIHCAKCDKDFKPGQYDPRCNKFHTRKVAECEGCGRIMPLGGFCKRCEVYVGVSGARYDKLTGGPKAN